MAIEFHGRGGVRLLISVLFAVSVAGTIVASMLISATEDELEIVNGQRSRILYDNPRPFRYPNPRNPRQMLDAPMLTEGGRAVSETPEYMELAERGRTLLRTENRYGAVRTTLAWIAAALAAGFVLAVIIERRR